MKSSIKHFLTIVLITILSINSYALFAQGKYKCVFNVRTTDGKPLTNTDVDVIDVSTKKKLTAKTDASGKVEMTLDGGIIWQLAILKVRDFWNWQFELPPNTSSQLGEFSRTFTYNYEGYRRETRLAVDRTQLNLKLVKQSYQSNEKASATDGVILLQINKADRTGLGNFPVRITCYNLNTIYETTTNAGGIATFKVPINNEFQIDIDGIENYHYVDLPNFPNYTAKAVFTYEPTTVTEKNVNDTITQSLTGKVKGTSGRAAITLKARKSFGEMWINEPFYLETLGDKKVYKVISNASGEMQLLLPKGKRYMIHGKYEKNIDVVDLTRTRGIAYSNKGFVYRPIDRYQYPERYFPKPEDLAFQDFIQFIGKQFKAPAEGDGLLAYARWGNKVNKDSKDALLELNFISEKLTASNKRPLNLALVLDHSGSMSAENRIDKVKKALFHFVDVLKEDDYISLTIFDDEKTVLIPSQKVGKDKNYLREEISYIEANGGTNIGLGLENGYKELEKNFKKKITNRVILLTDGYGSDDPLKTIQLANDYHKKFMDCSVVGVGDDYNFGLLRSIGNIGGGLIEFLDDKDKFDKIFTNSISASAFPLAENIKVEVTYNKQLLFAQLFGVPLTEKNNGKITLKLRNVYSGLDQLALIKFTLVNPNETIQKEPVTIKMKYFDVQAEKMVEKTTVTYLEWSQASGKLEFIMDNETKYYYSVALLNQTMKVMAESFAKGDREGAKNAIINSIKEVKEIFPTVTDKEVEELIAKLKTYEEILVNLK